MYTKKSVKRLVLKEGGGTSALQYLIGKADMEHVNML